MNRGLLGAVGCVLVIGVGLAWWLNQSPGSARVGVDVGAEHEPGDGEAQGASPGDSSSETIAGRSSSSAERRIDSTDRGGVFEEPSIDEAADGEQTAARWTLTGRVEDEANEPLGGVVVRVARQPSWFQLDEVEVGRTLTEANGAFTLSVPAPKSQQPLRVTVEPETHVWAMRTLPLDLPSGALGTWVVQRGGGVEGVVTGSAGQPIADAEVRVSSQPNRGGGGRVVIPGLTDPIQRVVRTDTRGRFRVAGVEAGTATVTARAPGWVEGRTSGIAVSVDETTDGVVVALDEGAVMAGRVVDEAGRPISGARVSAVREANPWGIPTPGRDSVTTDDDGAFRLDQLAPSPCALRADAPGYMPETTGVFQPGDVGIRITVRASGILHGQIVDADTGEPITDVTVLPQMNAWMVGDEPDTYAEVLFGDDVRELIEPEADVAGRFAVRGITQSTLHLAFSSPGRVPVTYGPVNVPSGERADATISMGLGVPLTGTVVDAEGVAVADADVTFTPTLTSTERESWMPSEDGQPIQRAQWTPTTVQTDEQGAFLFEGLRPGDGSLVANHETWQPSEAVEMVLSVEEPPAAQRLALRSGGTLYGMARGREGQPLAQARVEARRATNGERRRRNRKVSTTTTAADGSYELGGLPAGDYVVQLKEAGNGMFDLFDRQSNEGTPVRIEASERVELDLQLAPVGSCVVRVLSADGPLAGVQLAIAGTDSSRWSSSNPRTDDEGLCRFDGLEFDTWTVTVTPPGGAPPVRKTVEIAGVQEQRVDVELPGGRVTGRVVDAMGVGVEGAWLGLSGASSASPREELNAISVALDVVSLGELAVLDGSALSGRNAGTAKSGVDGRFEIPYVADGTYQLAVRGGSALPSSMEVTVGEQAADLTMTVTRAVVLTVEVTSDELLQWVKATLTSTSDPSQTHRANGFGHRQPIRMQGVPPGEWTLRVESGELAFEKTLMLEAGERAVEAPLSSL